MSQPSFPWVARLVALALLLLGGAATVWTALAPPQAEGHAGDFSRRRDGGEESEEDWVGPLSGLDGHSPQS